MNKFIVCLILIVVTACSHVPYTRNDKLALGCDLIAGTADIATTSYALKNNPNVEEKNPLIGKHPSDGELVAWGIGWLLVKMALGEVMPEKRVWIFGSSCAVHGGLAVWNVGQF